MATTNKESNMITKRYLYKATLATVGKYQNITLYTRNAKELHILYDYGIYVKHVKYNNANEAVNDFYNKIRFLHKYTNEVELTLAGSNFITKGGVI